MHLVSHSTFKVQQLIAEDPVQNDFIENSNRHCGIVDCVRKRSRFGKFIFVTKDSRQKR
jgi:hypothetical protein